MKKHLVFSNRQMLNHGISSHPEHSGRLEAILTALEESPYQQYMDLSIHRLASPDEISLVHDLSYIQYVLSLDGKESSLDHETLLSAGSVQAARLAAGLGIEAIEQVVEGKAENGFVLVRPPGHHARTATGMGFCIFNNIAIAAKKALSLGIKRILIIDFDVHHGNGTQETFYDDDRVLLIDLHQNNLFPANSGLLNEMGRDRGLGFTVNVPLPNACTDLDYLYIFDHLVTPLAYEYQPELILVSAGFDAHESDPLGGMKLTTEGYGLLTTRIKSLAKKMCNGKVVFFLEGGYDPYFLAKNVIKCINILTQDNGSEIEDQTMNPQNNIVKTIVKQVYESHIKQIKNSAREPS